jgi:hypothetical protein
MVLVAEPTPPQSPTPSASANAFETMDLSLVSDRDYSIILGRSRRSYDVPELAEDWQTGEGTIETLMQLCEALDRDGITIYSGTPTGYETYHNVTEKTLAAVIQSHCPPSELCLAGPLGDAIDSYLIRKSAGTTAANGEIILAFIDGEPEDRQAIVRGIVKVTQQMKRDEELGIGLIQIGKDSIAKGFFKALDEDLHRAGARFDIVHSCSLESLNSADLVEFLTRVIRL